MRTLGLLLAISGWPLVASAQSDPLASLEHIPLPIGIPASFLTVGGEVRERFEGYDNLNFGIGAGNDDYWLQRIKLSEDLQLGPRVQLFAEAVSGLIEGQTGPPPPVERDPLDLAFAYLEVVPYLQGADQLSIRVGRLPLRLGSGRLVDIREATNIESSFDGFEAVWSAGWGQVTCFLTRPVEDDGHFGGDNDATTFWGCYATHWFDQARHDGFDLYYLGIDNFPGSYASGTADEHRHTFGFRGFGASHQWDWNNEEAVQVGTFGTESILAWTASIDGGYTFDLPTSPRAGLKFDVTSGDRDPGHGRQETFDALFFKAPYFDDASLLSPQNVIDLHPNLGFKPSPQLELDGGTDWFWRFSRNDAIYSAPGPVSIAALRGAPAYVGTAWDLNLHWQMQRHLSLQMSYVYFNSGRYVLSAGGHNVSYLSATLDFVF
jgi:hypothetical protein